ncbi:MAG: TetR/AcrR family transcriptional regulator [Novosphingobium sp.]
MDGNSDLQARAEGGALTKGQRTANRILDAAEELFAQNGYGATSLRDIAAKVGVQQPGLYKHFAGKDELYRKVYERALQPMTNLMDEVLARADADFTDLTDRMTDLLAQHPNIARLLIRAAISSDSEPDPIGLDWLGRMVGYGRKMNEKAGQPSSDDSLAMQIVAIFNMLFGFFWASPLIESLSGRQATDPEAMAIQKGLLRGFIGSLSGTART